MLEVTGLSVRYRGAGTPAVNNATFHVGHAESVGVLGESGCGKSTMAKALLAILPGNAEVTGSIAFHGKDLLRLDARPMRRVRGAQIALIPQDPAQSLNPVLTIGVQISEVVRSHSEMDRDQTSQRVLEALRDAGFVDPVKARNRYPHQLSGGERQRAAIAQAIVNRPELLIADEPTTKLDARLRVELLEMFQRLRTRFETALMIISHDPGTLARHTDRLLVMYGGEVVETGSTAEMLRAPLHPYSVALTQIARDRSFRSGASKSPAGFRFTGIPGESGGFTPQGCSFEPRCGDRMAACSLQKPVLIRSSQPGCRQVSCLKYDS